ncbi:MAG: amino acid permease [Chlamydiae bacterium CG10_big_fil_rev_8_21_14_0_10_35_9]|nr:MAG: amino acid permease [Chlamydiae bacterium CG10_big_fil_rev_8_21_14_0_10_35_9]
MLFIFLMKKGSHKVLSSFTLAMIAVSAIVSLRNLPLTANYGLGSIFFYTIAGVSFLIPTALVAAELATTWPKAGGLYVWISEAFGHKYGFLATWLEWVMNSVWNPTALSFIAATFAYIINPDLINSRLFMITVMLVVFWGATFLNLLGMKTSSLISSIGVIGGTIIPGLFLILLAIIWLAAGHPSQISFSIDSIIPSLELDNLVFFTAVLLGLAGMEVAAFHASEVKNPDKEYPKAILYATIIILTIFIFGTLAIAVVLPSNKISLVAGLMQAVDAFLLPFQLNWATKVFGSVIIIGTLAMISTWIVGPSHGLLATAQHGDLPTSFSRTNKNGMPTAILMTQACIASLLILILLLMPNVNAFYWILTDLTAQLTTLIYILMFSAAIRLRYTQPNKHRPYRVFGGNAGMWIVAGLGLLASIFALFMGFVPPRQVETGSIFFMNHF